MKFNNRKEIILTVLGMTAGIAGLLVFSQLSKPPDINSVNSWWQKEPAFTAILANPIYQTPILEGEDFLFGNSDKNLLSLEKQDLPAPVKQQLKAQLTAKQEIGGDEPTTILPKDFSKGYKIISSLAELELLPLDDKLFNIIQGEKFAASIYQNAVVYASGEKAFAYLYDKKNNQLKEFIILKSPRNDEASQIIYSWRMKNAADYRIQYEKDGSIGFYGLSPLYKNITTGTEKDAILVQKLQEQAPKDFLYFQIPAPYVVNKGAGITNFGIEEPTFKGQGSADLFWEVSGDVLSLKIGNLKLIENWKLKIGNSSLIIDPTVVITSNSDFKDANEQGTIQENNSLKQYDVKNGTTTAWTTTSSLLWATNSMGTTAYNGYLYVVGGAVSGATSCVEYAQINATGSLGAWATTSSLIKARSSNSAVAYNGYLYAIAGATATPYNTVEYAQINATGSLGAWATTSSLIGAQYYFYDFGAAAYNGYIYTVGGHDVISVTSTVEYAQINATGSLGAWTYTTFLKTAKRYIGVVAHNNYLYVIGGSTGSLSATVEYARINSNGTIGTWGAVSSLSNTRQAAAVGVSNGYLYVMGGNGGGGYYSSVEYTQINSDGTLGTWAYTSSFNTARSYLGGVAYNGYLYVIGGQTSTPTVLSSVEYAQISTSTTAADKGGTGTWSTTSALKGAIRLHGAAAYNGYLYAIGGWDVAATSVVEYAAINSTGTLGAWTTTNSLIKATYGLSAVAYNRFLYAVGGSTGSATSGVEYSLINATGSLNTWKSTSALNGARYYHSAVAYNGYLYAVGGYDSANSAATSTVEYAAINSTGTIGTWATTSALDTARYYFTAAAYNGYLYAIAGSNGSGLTSVEYAQINATGSLGAWQTTSSLNAARYSFTGAAYNGYLYAVAGKNDIDVNGTSSIEYVQINATGSLATWATTTSVVLGLITSFSDNAAAYNGYLYAIGGFSNGAATSAVEYALIQTNGTLGSWKTTSALNIARYNYTSAAYNGYLYAIAGNTTVGATATVEYVQINSTGTVGTWAYTSSLNQERFAHAAAAYNGYLYAVGGATSTTSFTSVEYATINSTGTVGTWAYTSSLNTERQNLAVAVYNGYLYAIGGYSSSNLTSVEYVQINATGSLGTWQTTSSLNTARYAHAAVAYNGYLYAVGGRVSSSIYPFTSVEYVQINSTGALGAWATTSSLITARYYTAAVVYNGYLYAVAGYGTSTSLSAIECAPISASGTLGYWFGTTKLNTAKAAASVVYSGYLYVIGGWTTSASTGVEYIPISSQARVSYWSKLFNLSSDQSSTTVTFTGNVENGGGILLRYRTKTSTSSWSNYSEPVSVNSGFAYSLPVSVVQYVEVNYHLISGFQQVANRIDDITVTYGAESTPESFIPRPAGVNPSGSFLIF